MREKLERLSCILKKNGYLEEARKVEELMIDIVDNHSDVAKRRLLAMCNPRYLGDIYIAEFNSISDWWNFLEDISMMIKK